jgi:uncharacterized protein YnzC (UPF0291/DUF896 family)
LLCEEEQNVHSLESEVKVVQEKLDVSNDKIKDLENELGDARPFSYIL